MPKHMKNSESSLARKRAALIRSPSKVSKRASTTDTKLCTPEERARERRPRLLLEDNSDADDDSAKKSDGNSSDDRAKASVEHDAAHGANAVPLTSQVAAVTVADVAAQIDARGSVSIAADRAGNDENAGGNTKLNALNMDEARMLITSLKAAKAFRDA